MDHVFTVIGSYPRPGWFRDYLKEREGLQKDYSSTTSEEYEKAVSQVIGEQKKAQVELYTDGQLIWHDFLCHLCSRLPGVEMNGIIRYFDNNLYYRMPKAVSEINWRPLTVEQFKIAYSIGEDTKPVLSCYTLAELTQNEYYSSREDLLMAIAKAMNQEARALRKEGARHIQISEPSLINAERKELPLIKDALQVLTKDVDVEFSLATYFDSIDHLFPQILDLPVDVLGLDFIEGHEKNMNALKEHPPQMKIQAGVVNGRTTWMEDTSRVRDLIEEISELTDDQLYLCPNTGLEHLPYQKAREKLEVLNKAITEVKN